MRIREAKVRDAQAIYNLLPESEKMSVDAIMGMIMKKEANIFVACDFSTNILACSMDSERIYVSSTCADTSVADELKKQY